MPTTLSDILTQYPFERYDDTAALGGVHGIYLIIECTPCSDAGIECNLVDFGGAVDIRHAIETSMTINGWQDIYKDHLNIMVAAVSLMECETLLKELRLILMANGQTDLPGSRPKSP